jgi:tyrosinase
MDRIVDMERMVVTVSSLENFRDQIIKGINQGFFVGKDGERHVLDDVKGIDILGNVIESSALSPNVNFYGGNEPFFPSENY